MHISSENPTEKYVSGPSDSIVNHRLRDWPGHCAILGRRGQKTQFTTVAMQITVCVTDKYPLSKFVSGLVMLNSGALWAFGVRSVCWMQKEPAFDTENPHRR